MKRYKHIKQRMEQSVIENYFHYLQYTLGFIQVATACLIWIAAAGIYVVPFWLANSVGVQKQLGYGGYYTVFGWRWLWLLIPAFFLSVLLVTIGESYVWNTAPFTWGAR